MVEPSDVEGSVAVEIDDDEVSPASEAKLHRFPERPVPSTPEHREPASKRPKHDHEVHVAVGVEVGDLHRVGLGPDSTGTGAEKVPDSLKRR